MSKEAGSPSKYNWDDDEQGAGLDEALNNV
jgi:hypothetical protein